MLRVCLTGGIGCGKSTVAAMLRELGCHVLEADTMAHRLIEPGGAAYEEVVREFGREILDPAGRVDRARLAEIVFADPTRLARLNAIIHPRVLADVEREIERIGRRDPGAIVVVEAALLVEARYHERLDRLVVVWCTPEQQMARLTHPRLGRGMTPEQARRRIAAQLPLEEKRRLADDVIDNSGSMEQTRRQVATLVEGWKRALASQNA